MGNITIQGDLTGDVPGGEVGGASNLTTVGAIPYVSAAGILNQDPTALFWDAANDRLGVGTNSPTQPLHVSGATSGNIISRISNTTGAAYLEAQSSSNIFTFGSVSTYGFIWGETNHPLVFGVSGGEASRFAATTRNLLIGTTTDSNFKLDVATSGSAGTARFYGGAGVSDSTKVVVRAGTGQGATNLTEWQDSAGAVLAYVGVDGRFGSNSFLEAGSVSYIGWTSRSQLYSPSSGVLQMVDSSGTSFNRLQFGGTSSSFPSLKRSSATLEVRLADDSAFTELALLRSRHNGVTVADLPTAAAGNAGSIQYVTDANATTIGSTVAGGGANKVMVWSDGAAWKIFAS